MIPNSDLENPEVPLCLVFLSMTLRRILMTGALLYISVVWTPKSVLTRYGTTPYCNVRCPYSVILFTISNIPSSQCISNENKCF